MTLYAYLDNAQFVAIEGPFTIGDGDDAIQYPANWPDHATADDLASHGVYVVQEAGAVDQTRILTGSTIANVGGLPVQEWTYSDYALADAKNYWWTQAKLFRDDRMSAGAMTPGGLADSTETSLVRANGAASTALVSLVAQQPWTPIAWTMADNTIYNLATPQMALAFASAIGAYIAECQYAGTAIRNAIDSAVTSEDVFKIDITAGYP